MQKLKAVFFDVGNTIALIDHAFIQSAIMDNGIEVTKDQIMCAEVKARQEVDKLIEESNGKMTEIVVNWTELPYNFYESLLRHLNIFHKVGNPVMETLKEQDRKMCLWNVLDDEAIPVLEALKAKGLKLAAVSNSDGNAEKLMENLGVAKYFDVIIDSWVVNMQKPDPRIFDLALKKTQIAADETIFIGDIYGVDIVGASRAGIKAFLIDRTGTYNPPCDKIRKLSEVLNIVKSSLLA